MKLVEVIPGMLTSDETFEKAMEISREIGKTPVKAPDTSGFLVNKLLVTMWNEAAFLVMEGNKPEDIDAAMKLGANLPMGPCELADFAGLDTVLAVMTEMFTNIGDTKYRPCPLLKKMVAAGLLGRKSGKGFYSY
jgi:3-hydroxybutyryl-CoA dehydrogenase